VSDVDSTEQGRTPAEWLRGAVDAVELRWASDGQEDALITVVEELAEGLEEQPPTALRLGQALLARPELPEANTLPSVAGIRDLIAKASPVTAQSPDGVAWCQVAALCAAGIAIERGSANWIVVSSALREGDHAWVRALLAPTLAAALKRSSAPPRWPALSFPGDITEHPLDPEIERALRVYTYPTFGLTHKYVRTEYKLEDIKKRSVQPVAQRLSDMSGTLADAVNRLGAWMEAVETRMAAALETNALWWGQALFSLRRGAAYRDLPTADLLVVMADDLLDAIDGQVTESVVAYFVETSRRLVHGLDAERPWSEHAARMTLAPEGARELSPLLRSLVADEATGLPLAYLISGGHPGRMVSATMASARAVTGRAWARQVFRERQLNRWFHLSE